MAIKIYKPTTPSRRKTSILKSEGLSRARPQKRLTSPRKQKSGRNSSGRITIRHRGGGAKRKVRIVDFRQEKYNIPAEVKSVEYDPNRGANLALVFYADGEKRYILAPDGLKVGDKVLSTLGHDQEIRTGNRMPLEHIPVGMPVHNIEMSPGKGGQVVRGAGTLAQIMAVDGPHAQLKMPSTEIRLFAKECMASIGQVSNPDHRHVRIGSAGRKRRMGIRPTVRGKAMNPVDHPHGGGEGKSPIGLKHPKTPWGKTALGVRTRKSKTSDRLIVKRRQAKKRKK